MLIKKITSGFVIQTFDTELKRFIAQEFVAGGECDYENEKGESVDSELLDPNYGQGETYLPYDMVQPMP